MRKEIIGDTLYRVARARYNGVWVDDCLIPEKSYSAVKSTRRRRTKKTPRRLLIDQIDHLWSEAVKIKWGFKCAYCGKTQYLQSHHIFSRGKANVRFDLDNGIALCAGHHTLNDFSAHKSPKAFFEWLEDLVGKNKVNQIEYRSRITKSHGIRELEMIKYNLENYIKQHG